MDEHLSSQAPHAGWRERAERIAGPLRPYASPTLSASEIGEFGFCPQAWFLSRCNIPVDEQARVRLHAGSRAHQRIGRRTDLVRMSEQTMLVLLAVMAILTIIIVVVALSGGL